MLALAFWGAAKTISGCSYIVVAGGTLAQNRNSHVYYIAALKSGTLRLHSSRSPTAHVTPLGLSRPGPAVTGAQLSPSSTTAPVRHVFSLSE